MSKVIFLGTDLHGEKTELAAKSVEKLKEHFDHYIVSIENRKKRGKFEKTNVIPRLSNNRLRKIFQGFLLPLILVKRRAKGDKKILSFWVTNKRYHNYLYGFLKLIGFRIYFTVIEGHARLNEDNLKYCYRIICQSKRMYRRLRKRYGDRVKIIRPGVDLKYFQPGKKEIEIMIPSVPYNVEDFDQRGINDVLDIIEKGKLKAVILLRSKEAFEYIAARNQAKVFLIMKALDDKELGKWMGKARIVPLFYSVSPDTPLSIVEALACGCHVVCSDKIGMSEWVEMSGVGKVVKTKAGLAGAIKDLLKKKTGNKKSREIAEKMYDPDVFVEKYRELVG